MNYPDPAYKTLPGGGLTKKLKAIIDTKQDKLVSGENIKTINNESLLGSGNIVIPQGPKGDQGNSGYTGAAGELEVVNNLTQGGATAALSAEMGKELGDKTRDTTARTKNLFDPYYLISLAGWSKQSGDVYTGTLINLYLNFYRNNTYYPVEDGFKENTQYTWSIEARVMTSGLTGNGAGLFIRYTDNTISGVWMPNSTTSWTDFKVTSTAGKTVKEIAFNASSGTDKTWEFRNIQLEEGAAATDYIPYRTAIDYIARHPNLDTTPTEGSITGIQSGAVWNESRAIVDEKIPASLYEKSFIQGIVYEMGNVSISSSGWTYSASTTRVRTPQGYVLHLYAGDKIGLSDYTNARYYLGWRGMNGIYGSQGWLTADYTVIDEAYFCVLICNTTDTEQTSPHDLGSLVQIHRNKSVGKIIEANSDMTLITESDMTLIQDDKYINQTGVIGSSSAHKIIGFNAKKGDLVCVRNDVTDLENFASVFARDTGQSNYNSIEIATSANNDYWYLCENDEMLVMTIRKTRVSNVFCVRSKNNEKILSTKSKTYVDILPALNKERGYIKYSDGSFNTTGSLIYVYYLPVSGINKIRVRTGASDSLAASIAFYSSELVSTSTYVSGVQARLNYSGGTWNEASVPNTAVLACITNHSSYEPNPIIQVDEITKPLLNLNEAMSSVNSLQKATAFCGNNPWRFGGQFMAHMFLDKIYQDSTNIVIPSESLADIRVARRMGFKVIEANVQTTSDGKFIVIHGSGGKFGYEVVDLDGNFTYADTSINTKTLDWIKTNIRYRSDIARYRTPIPTLEEFLTECKINGMIPMAQASTSAMVSILDKYMGYGNYIAYNGNRSLTNAPILYYKSLATKDEILADCRNVGVPYIYSMGNMASFTDDELSDIVQSLHAEGYMIATAYANYNTGNRAIRLGFDLIASNSFVPQIECGNICNYGADATFSDFNVTGAGASVSDSVITITGAATITPKNITDTVFIGVGELRVVYDGSINVTLRGASQVISSDGVNEMVFSTYFINEVPTFTLSNSGSNATIYDITYRASKV